MITMREAHNTVKKNKGGMCMKRIRNVMKRLLLSLVIVAGLWGVSTLDARAEESGTTRNYADVSFRINQG